MHCVNNTALYKHPLHLCSGNKDVRLYVSCPPSVRPAALVWRLSRISRREWLGELWSTVAVCHMCAALIDLCLCRLPGLGDLGQMLVRP